MNSRPPRPVATLVPPPMAKAQPQNPAGLLYTILRHGRALSHEEAARRVRESVGSPPFQAA